MCSRRKLREDKVMPLHVRLLETTRAYALDRGCDDAELAARHATYYRRWLEQSGTQWPTLSSAAERAPHLAALGNVRAALEWCFGPTGNAGIGVGLASAAAPVFLAMSLLTECHRWSERAILALDHATSAGPEEMQLQTALALSLTAIVKATASVTGWSIPATSSMVWRARFRA